MVAVISVLGTIAFYFFGSSNAQEQAKPCEGKVGDVKYSVLIQDKFKQLNGNEWELMDGRSIENSFLADFAKFKTIPDARGVFIRGMNLDRPKEQGDADGNREIGLPQTDTFKKHNHRFNVFVNAPDGPPTWRPWATTSQNAANTWTTSDDGGEETRPRNIALYTYIKINKCQGEK